MNTVSMWFEGGGPSRPEALATLRHFVASPPPPDTLTRGHAPRQTAAGHITLPWIEILSSGAAVLGAMDVVGGRAEPFDWSRWRDAQMPFDGDWIERAGLHELAMLRLCLERADRFCEGTIGGAFSHGFYRRIAVRMLALSHEDD